MAVTEVDVRRLLLNFYSSELNSHARLIIGAAALFFTIVNVILDISSKVSALTAVQNIIAFISLLSVSFILWFLVMRYLAYGVLSHAVTVAVLPAEVTYESARRAVIDRAFKEKILRCIPSYFFISFGERRSRMRGMGIGLVLCFLFALAITDILWTFMGLSI
jgi:hypothetical protein